MLFRLELAAHLVNDEGCIYCKQFDLKTSPYQNSNYTFYMPFNINVLLFVPCFANFLFVCI